MRAGPIRVAPSPTRKKITHKMITGHSSPEFIEKVSGIRARHFWDKAGVLDASRMCPVIPDRSDDELSVQAEFAVDAARAALA